MAKPHELLLLKYHDLRNEVAHLFEVLNSDQSLRELFFTNPILVIRTKLPSLSPIDLNNQQDEVANRILFSVLTNNRFIDFLNGHQKKKRRLLDQLLRDPGNERIIRQFDERAMKAEFAAALLKFGDKELISNLLGSTLPPTPTPPTLIIFHTILLLEVAVLISVHVLVQIVVKLAIGTAGEAIPRTLGDVPISASELRRITDQLLATAQKMRENGGLTP